MRILMVRGNKVDPDPRVEKEVNSLIKNRRHQVTVLAWDRTDSYDLCEGELTLPNGSARIIRFGIPATWGGGMKKNAKSAIDFHRKATKWMQEHLSEFDAIHATSFTIGNAAIRYQKKGVKLVYDIYDYYADIHQTGRLVHGLISKTENRVINHADATIICSEERKGQISGTHPKKLYVIHNAPSRSMMDVHKSGRLCKTSSDLPKIVYVGNLIPDRYIDHVAEIAVSSRKFELHIGGFGILEKKISDYADRYDNVFFYGKMPYDEVLQLESECDILLALYDPRVPNHKYAAPNKFYEALFLGKPVIMFKNTGMDRVVTDYSIGEVAEFSDVSLLDAINRIIEKRVMWPSIADREQELFRTNYSWEIMEQRLLSLYDTL